jgi:hypothetical protein
MEKISFSYYLFNKKLVLLMTMLVLNSLGNSIAAADWKPAQGPLLTKWAKTINPDKVHQEYPRPQMVREQWLNLNGLWQYAIQEKSACAPETFDGDILVPFPVESALSGVGKTVGEEKTLWYKRNFNVPERWQDQRIMLNFGAVDWQTTVWVNGKQIGSHKGGYDAFSFDITDALKQSGSQELLVSVWDPTDVGYQPRGKQVADPHGIWYTPVTGIWQTVWLEPVGKAAIKSFKVITDIDENYVYVTPECNGVDDSYRVKVTVSGDGKEEGNFTAPVNNPVSISILEPKLWSPDSPFLYDLEIELLNGQGDQVDKIGSYLGMRKTSLAKDDKGVLRMMLNNEFVFQVGPLDQGWWPDGLYTPPSDEALKYDIEITKELGFNMARKHVKIEPARWYYWCDKLGLLVWQDMPSGEKYIGRNSPDIERSPESAKQFEYELKRMIDGFYNHPSIVMWVPFNEGWGQWDTPRIVELTRAWDPTRLVNHASGWTDRGIGDVNDIHSYPGPDIPELEENRAAVLGEFGGLGLPVEGHTWQDKDNWGYRNYKDSKALTDAYLKLMTKLEILKEKGLSAAVYTQTTDVEAEVNGLLSYDRAVIKMDPKNISAINQGYLPPVILSSADIFLESLMVELKSARHEAKTRYTLDGSEPTKKSALYQRPFEIKKSVTVKARSFFKNGIKSAVNDYFFEKVAPLKPGKVGTVEKGIYFNYYETDDAKWLELPNFEKLEPTRNGIIEKIDLSMVKVEEKFGLVFEGYFKAEAEGIFTFYTTSDDGSALYIDDRQVVNNDFTHGMEEKSGQVALQPGLFPIRIEFFQGVGGQGLSAHFKAPNGEKANLAKSLFYKK